MACSLRLAAADPNAFVSGVAILTLLGPTVEEDFFSVSIGVHNTTLHAAKPIPAYTEPLSSATVYFTALFESVPYRFKSVTRVQFTSIFAPGKWRWQVQFYRDVSTTSGK